MGRLGVGHQHTLPVKFKNANAAHAPFRRERLNVHRTQCLGQLFTQPGAGLSHGDLMQVPRFEQLPLPVCQWRHVVTHHEGDQHKAQAQAQLAIQEMQGKAAKAMAAYIESCMIRSRRADRLAEESLLSLLPTASD